MLTIRWVFVTPDCGIGSKRVRVLRWAAVAVLGVTSAFAADRPANNPATESAEQSGSGSAADRESRYRVQPGDVIEFQFRFTPEFNQTVRVQPDGYIPLQDAGELKVGGLTVAETREATIQAYREKLNDPVVNVILKEFTIPQFTVGGEVVRPGRYDLPGDVKLSEAIEIAGGFNSTQASEILLFRQVAGDWVETKKIHFKKAPRNELQEDIALKPGDSIYVSRSKLGVVERFMESSKLGLFFNQLSAF